MIIHNLIKQLHKLVDEFSQQTSALDVTFEENKKLAEWTVKYNIIKFQFLLTKKDRIACPVSTLYCRVYFGKNEAFYFHIPEIMAYLEPENYQCYYFPYIESEERLNACFSVLSEFLKKHYETIQAFAKSAEMSAQIKAAKIEDMVSLFTDEEPEPEEVEFVLGGYEDYVLLIRNAGEGAYRQFVCRNYEKALNLYEKMGEKGQLTSYEKGLCEFIRKQSGEYIALPEECNTLFAVEQKHSTNAETKNMLKAALIGELVFGVLFAIIVAIIHGILSQETVYYAGMPWYDAFIFAGMPAIFGGIAFRNGIGKKEDSLAKLINPKWVENMAQVAFVITFIGMLFICFSCAFMSTGFYMKHMKYNDGEELFPINFTTCNYENLKNVYYSDGLYNDYGDYIERASYLLEFEDGTVWDSDGFISIEEVEEHVLPIIASYYGEVKYIKASDELANKETIDYSDYSFVNVEWTRKTETCTENLYFSDDGDIRTFEKVNEDSVFNSEIVYNDKTYHYLEFNADIFYYDLKESVDYEEDEIISIPHSKWDLIYCDGDLYIVDAQAEEAIAYYGDDANYTWSVAIDNLEDIYTFPISVNSEDISYIYSMDSMETKTTLFFEDIELFASLIKTSEDGLISASTSLAGYENAWYWRSETIDESVEGWPEYVVELNESLLKQINEGNATIKK